MSVAIQTNNILETLENFNRSDSPAEKIIANLRKTVQARPDAEELFASMEELADILHAAAN